MLWNKSKNIFLLQTGGVSNEIRENKLRQLMVQVGAGVGEEECLAALQQANWDVPVALRQLKLDSLTRYVMVT